MDTTKQYDEQQDAKRLHDRIASFIGDHKIGTLLNQSGIRRVTAVAAPEGLDLHLIMRQFEQPAKGMVAPVFPKIVFVRHYEKLEKVHRLLGILQLPFTEQPDTAKYMLPPKREERVLQTFCGA